MAGAVLTAVGFTAVRPGRVLRVFTGAASHTLCSAAFVSGLDPDGVFGESTQGMPGVGLIKQALRYKVDTARREVRATLAGGFASRAVYRDGLGCLVVRGEDVAGGAQTIRETAESSRNTDIEPPVSGPAEVRAVLDRAFDDPGRPPSGWLKAVVVMRDGQIVAEKYAPGYSARTPLLGWSVTKSVINALVGILVRQGRLAVEQRRPCPNGATLPIRGTPSPSIICCA